MAIAVGEAPTANTEPTLTEKDVPAGLGDKLAAAFESPDIEPETRSADDSSDTVAGSNAAEAAESSAPNESAAEAESEVEAEAKETASTPQGPVLPAAFKRTLKAYEYTDEEIEEGLKTQGDKFVAVAARLHNARNKEIAKFAEEGRRAKAAKQSPPTPALGSAEDDLAPVDVMALKKIYGDNEPLIDQLVTPLNKALAEIKSSRAVIQQYQQQQKQATQETFAAQVNGFFAGDELKDFHDQYGTKMEMLTDAQKNERVKVLRMADELLTGSAVAGRVMTLPEALQLAHDATSSETKEKTVRQQLASQLTKREKSMTLKPAGRASTPSKGTPSTKLRENVKSGLAKAFG